MQTGVLSSVTRVGFKLKGSTTFLPRLLLGISIKVKR